MKRNGFNAGICSICILIGSVGCSKNFTSHERIKNANEQKSIIQSSQKNLLLIVGDDVGYENLTCNGGQSYVTESLDLLAQHGMRFTQARSCPLCSPSRIELFTGKYNQRNYTKWGALGADQKTIFNVFHDAGYQTGIFGKLQIVGDNAFIHNMGIDNYVVDDYRVVPYGNGNEGESHYFRITVYSDSTNGERWDSTVTNAYYGPDLYEEEAEKFINKSVADSKPFFLDFSSILCHAPFSPTPLDPEYAAWQAYPWNKHADKKFYPSMMEYMDILIGKLLNHMQSLGILNNTVVVFIGDNGTPQPITSLWKDSLGNIYNVQGGKGTTKETGLRVPMIVNNGFDIGVDNGILDFSDFIYALPDMVGISRPDTTVYGHLDAVSFIDPATGHVTRSGRRVWSYDAFGGVKGTTWKYFSETIDRKKYDDGTSTLYRTNWPGNDQKIKNDELTQNDKKTRKILVSVNSAERE